MNGSANQHFCRSCQRWHGLPYCDPMLVGMTYGAHADWLAGAQGLVDACAEGRTETKPMIIDDERTFTDAIINAIGEISVMEAQEAIRRWRVEHPYESNDYRRGWTDGRLWDARLHGMRTAVYYDIFETYVPPTCLCGCYSGGCGRPDGCFCTIECGCQGNWP